MFADDLVIFTSGKNLNNIKIFIQNIVTSLQVWSTNHGFKINEQKTKVLHFHRKTIQQDNINIYINNQPIEQVSAYKFFGVYFDEKLNFKKHKVN